MAIHEAEEEAGNGCIPEDINFEIGAKRKSKIREMKSFVKETVCYTAQRKFWDPLRILGNEAGTSSGHAVFDAFGALHASLPHHQPQGLFSPILPEHGLPGPEGTCTVKNMTNCPALRPHVCVFCQLKLQGEST